MLLLLLLLQGESAEPEIELEEDEDGTGGRPLEGVAQVPAIVSLSQVRRPKAVLRGSGPRHRQHGCGELKAVFR